MTTGELTSLTVGVVTGTLPAIAAFVLTLRHGWQIKDTADKVASHDVQLARLTPKHEKHCTSVEQISRAMEIQDRAHGHHRK